MKLYDIEAIRAHCTRGDLMDLALVELDIDRALCQFEGVPEPRFFQEIPNRPATEPPAFFNYHTPFFRGDNGELPDDKAMAETFFRYLLLAPERADY